MKIQVPLLLPALCLIAGMAGAAWLPWPGVVLAVFCGGVAVAWLLGRWPSLQNLCIVFCFFCLGAFVGQPREQSVALGKRPVEGVVFAEPQEKPKTVAVDLLLPSTGRQVRLYVWKDARSSHIRLGSPLVVSGMERGKGFVGSRQWRFGGNGRERLSRFDAMRLCFLGLRQKLLARYRQLAPMDENYAVLAAMTLGDKSALTPQLRHTYSVTGASHVLALSGLHLGMVYGLITMLTLGRRRYWLSQMAVMAGIWGFAFLTGLSVSVVRSATMLSIYALFSVAGRQRSPVNLLCFTAIAMLVVSPQSLGDIGFQLSFAAVLSILLFMPLAGSPFPGSTSWWRRPLRQVYGVLAVSLVAQVGVAPLIAYHFGRFSTYFLLTNLVVVFAAMVIVYGGLVVLLVPWLGGCLLWFVGLLNRVLRWLSLLPGASIEGLQPSVLQVVLVYMLFFLLYMAIGRLRNSPTVVN